MLVLAMTLFLRLLDEALGFNKRVAGKINVIGTIIETENTVADKCNIIFIYLALFDRELLSQY